MSQSLLDISPEAFELQLYKMSNRQLVGLIKRIYEYKKDLQGKLDPEAHIGIIANIEGKGIYGIASNLIVVR